MLAKMPKEVDLSIHRTLSVPLSPRTWAHAVFYGDLQPEDLDHLIEFLQIMKRAWKRGEEPVKAQDDST